MQTKATPSHAGCFITTNQKHAAVSALPAEAFQHLKFTVKPDQTETRSRIPGVTRYSRYYGNEKIRANSVRSPSVAVNSQPFLDGLPTGAGKIGEIT